MEIGQDLKALDPAQAGAWAFALVTIPPVSLLVDAASAAASAAASVVAVAGAGAAASGDLRLLQHRFSCPSRTS